MKPVTKVCSLGAGAWVLIPSGAFLMLDSWHEKNPCRCASASGTRVSGGFCQALQISAQGHETPDDASSASPRLEFRRTRFDSSCSSSHPGVAVCFFDSLRNQGIRVWLRGSFPRLAGPLPDVVWRVLVFFQ